MAMFARSQARVKSKPRRGQLVSRNVRKENTAWSAGRAEPIPISSVHISMTPGVLIVEDEFLLRMDAAEFMRDCLFIVYDASNADEAIARLELHGDIRAVFTDIHMPGSMDGLKLAH